MLFVDDKGGEIYELINTAMIMPSLHHQEIYEHMNMCWSLHYAPNWSCEENAKLARILQMCASCNSVSQLYMIMFKLHDE